MNYQHALVSLLFLSTATAFAQTGSVPDSVDTSSLAYSIELPGKKGLIGHLECTGGFITASIIESNLEDKLVKSVVVTSDDIAINYEEKNGVTHISELYRAKVQGEECVFSSN